MKVKVAQSCPALCDRKSLELSRPEHWSGWPFPSPGDLPNPGIEPGSPASQADSLPTELPRLFSQVWRPEVPDELGAEIKVSAGPIPALLTSRSESSKVAHRYSQ